MYTHIYCVYVYYVFMGMYVYTHVYMYPKGVILTYCS